MYLGGRKEAQVRWSLWSMVTLYPICRFNPVEVLQLLAYSSLLQMGATWQWLFAEATLSLTLPGLFTTVKNFWACDFCLQQMLPRTARLWPS